MKDFIKQNRTILLLIFGSWLVTFFLYDRNQPLFWEMFIPIVAILVMATAWPFFLFEKYRLDQRPRPYDGEKVKMYCLASKEALTLMKGIRGKMMTQAGHAYAHALFDSMDRFPLLFNAYRRTKHAYKITLVVEGEDDLRRFENAYKDVCGVSLVTDAGFTVFEKPTTTCLGIGPIPEHLIGDDLKALKTLT